MTEEELHRLHRLEQIVTATETTIAYLERTIASLQKQFTDARESMDRLRDALTRPEFKHGDYEKRASYHEQEARFLREISKYEKERESKKAQKKI